MNVSTTQRTATAFGLLAIVLWSTVIGLIRSVSEHFGPIAGAALIYSVGAIFLFALLGRPRIRTFPRVYLIGASALFVAYEICLSLSLGFALDRVQAIELGIVNYLWPCLTVLLAVVFNGQRARWWVIPGIVLAISGIAWVMSGGEGLSLSRTLANVSSNPLSYTLAFSGALIWAVYCNVTKRWANGKNGVALFFLLTAITLWIKFLLSVDSMPHVSSNAVIELLITGGAMAAGYAFWNKGILHGNMTLLASASYFTPVLSTVFASVWLNTKLEPAFWQGVAMVTIGSLLCWAATKASSTR